MISLKKTIVRQQIIVLETPCQALSFNSLFLQVLQNSSHFAGLNDLTSLHRFLPPAQLLKGTDQATLFHKVIYKDFDDPNSILIAGYRKLVASIAPNVAIQYGVCPELLAVQTYPTVRIQTPNNISVFEFHRDSDYNHPLAETNCFYALTRCLDSSALQVEQTLGMGDYLPLNLRPESIAILNTSIFSHGDLPNLMNYTRVSFDFRFLPLSALGSSQLAKFSLSSSRPFSLGGYFTQLSKLELQ